MPVQLFNPFDNIYLDEKTCFLTGEELTKEDEYIMVFPEWILNQFDLKGKKFTMMDNFTNINYEDFKLPCSEKVKVAFSTLENEIEAAFHKGYDGVSSVDKQKLFLWMGKIIYGILYQDLLIERKKQEAKKLEFKISDALKKRFSWFHLMLQSLVAPIQFGNIKPWSIAIVQLKYSKDVFNYRGDTINLFFSLGMNGFGIIALLQDNNIVMQKESDLLQKLNRTILHPIQFEELKARFTYSNYLLKHKRTFKIKEENDSIKIEAVTPLPEQNNTLFDIWDNNLFADVLTEYWKPWGLQKNNIITYPNAPVSFLENEYTYELINPESIELPF